MENSILFLVRSRYQRISRDDRSSLFPRQRRHVFYVFVLMEIRNSRSTERWECGEVVWGDEIFEWKSYYLYSSVHKTIDYVGVGVYAIHKSKKTCFYGDENTTYSVNRLCHEAARIGIEVFDSHMLDIESIVNDLLQ